MAKELDLNLSNASRSLLSLTQMLDQTAAMEKSFFLNPDQKIAGNLKNQYKSALVGYDEAIGRLDLAIKSLSEKVSKSQNITPDSGYPINKRINKILYKYFKEQPKYTKDQKLLRFAGVNAKKIETLEPGDLVCANTDESTYRLLIVKSPKGNSYDFLDPSGDSENSDCISLPKEKWTPIPKYFVEKVHPRYEFTKNSSVLAILDYKDNGLSFSRATVVERPSDRKDQDSSRGYILFFDDGERSFVPEQFVVQSF